LLVTGTITLLNNALLSGGEDAKEMPTISIPGKLVRPSVVELVQLKHLHHLKNVVHLLMLLNPLKPYSNHTLEQRLQDTVIMIRNLVNLRNPRSLHTLLFKLHLIQGNLKKLNRVMFAVSE